MPRALLSCAVKKQRYKSKITLCVIHTCAVRDVRLKLYAPVDLTFYHPRANCKLLSASRNLCFLFFPFLFSVRTEQFWNVHGKFGLLVERKLKGSRYDISDKTIILSWISGPCPFESNWRRLLSWGTPLVDLRCDNRVEWHARQKSRGMIKAKLTFIVSYLNYVSPVCGLYSHSMLGQ